MSAQQYLNVYTGLDSLRNYWDPNKQPPLPLVEVPLSLNPFHQDGVRIYAKMMSALPANNVKALPAMHMLQSEKMTQGKIKTLVEYSSGSTVVSLGMIARILYGIEDTRAFLSNKTSLAKLQMMRFFGLNISVFGGPSQPEPEDARGGIYRAHKLAQDRDDTYNPNQYVNDLNWGAHMKWTGPQIIAQLPQINVFCAGMGTAGTMTGIGTYLKQAKPSITRVGVCTKPGDRVPGPRSHALLAPINFPWKQAVDELEECGSQDAYRLSMELSREGLVCGPSSGFNLQGLYNYLQKKKDAGAMKELSGDDGEIHCVFICCDLPYQYLDDYFVKLDERYFHPIQNSNLLNVDLHRYDEAWELEAPAAMSKLYSTTEIPIQCRPEWFLIDLRDTTDFESGHLPDAANWPLKSLARGGKSPFFESQVLEKQWLELESLFVSKNGNSEGRLKALNSPGHSVMILCYDGDTARVATSVLRARDIEAWSVRGGMLGYEFGHLLVSPINAGVAEQPQQPQQPQPSQIKVDGGF
ncbi:hypothetical protein VC83_08575 [Pseudogymnoascus destructans]|uniref:Rhodanese domain-containing protein n=2 Tax=Pseudogymnoascus destructans TaxID=655981 RepID=L8FZ85_PSED2|nr:uncharacterized protein VC83_08575 [Pseudogymnoascus destructans]ELR06325.1 hypothetical protein GMDG_07916 [Pseudogymnoascus destructans 20631-21]OAF54999.1 hypothetical protein VC83_08575 [Pseudogymnoascus destructans]